MGLIADYTSLQTELLTMLDSDDLTAQLPLMIQLGEQRIYRDIRCRGMEATLNVTMSGGVATVPSDYVELKEAYITYNSKRYYLERKLTDYINKKYPTQTAQSRPRMIAREINNFIFGPYPDQNYVLQGTYYKRLPSLTNTLNTNWFTDNAPDLLFWASLAESAALIREDNRIPLWESKYQSAKAIIHKEYKTERISGGPKRSDAG